MTTLDVRPPRRTAPTRRAVKGQIRGDRTRQLIIDETIRCVREEGFAATSASHIAERAGVTWGVIQYHFGDRNAVLMAVVDHGYDLLRNAIDQVEVPAGSMGERVQAVVDAGWNAFSNPASLAAFEILVATRASRELRLEEHLADLANQLARLGRTLDPFGRGRRRQAIGNLFWAALRGLALAQMVVREPIDFTHERRALVDLLTMHLESRGRGDISLRR
jgi:TetR/AcrR family transcriptional regulator, regulator of cefoperazone and chloramphenicol sensitivity